MRRINRKRQKRMSKRKRRISYYATPEEIDQLMKSRIRCKKKGNLPLWTEDEIEIRDGVIWEYIGRQGLSREETARQLTERWDIYISTARRYVAEAISRMANKFQDEEKEIRNIMNERLETIIQDAMEHQDRQSAIRAIETLSKLYGLSTEKKEITLKDTNITFDFE